MTEPKESTINKFNRNSAYFTSLLRIMTFVVVILTISVCVATVMYLFNVDLITDMFSDMKSADVYLTLLRLFIGGFFGVLVLIMLDRFFVNARHAGTPFTEQSADALRNISFMIAAAIIITIFVSVILHFMLGAGSINDFVLFIIMLFLAFLIYLISLTFKYGVILQKESDETL